MTRRSAGRSFAYHLQTLVAALAAYAIMALLSMAAEAAG